VIYLYDYTNTLYSRTGFIIFAERRIDNDANKKCKVMEVET